MKKLELRIFRFDKDKDYEAYYKPYVYDNYENFATFYDLFLQIKNDDIYFEFEQNEKAYIVVNKQFMPILTPLEKVIKEKCFELLIEPISIKRSIKDFLINRSDFLAKFKYLAKFADDEDKKFYESLDYLYYSSEILDFHKDFMGDALFCLAFEMIQKYPGKKQEILKIIADKESGIFYHLKGFYEEVEEKISYLQKEILSLNLGSDLSFTLPKIKAFEAKNLELKEIKHDFNGFNIAFYGFNPCESLKTKLKAKFINYEESSKNNGFTLLNLNEELAYKMAANVLLSAYDNGADFLVVKEEKDFFMFDSCAKRLSSVSGREFDEFYILSNVEFVSLIQGIFLPSLKEHKLKVSLI